MAITDWNLRPGQKLVATYKKQSYVCEVVQTEEGLRYRLDGKDHKSPSAAGSAVMGAMACNGWRFWSLEDEAPTIRRSTPREQEAGMQPGGTKKKVFKKARSQRGVPEGQVRWFCTACADHFLGDEAPAACPAGHLSETDGNGDLQHAQPTADTVESTLTSDGEVAPTEETAITE